MIMPRFTIRTALVGVTFCALALLVVGMAIRGETWAWGITIGLMSLIITLLVHAAWFGLAWTFARLPVAESELPMQAVAAAAPNGRPGERAGDHPENRGEA